MDLVMNSLYPSIGPGAGMCTIGGGRLITPSSSVTKDTDLLIRRKRRETRNTGAAPGGGTSGSTKARVAPKATTSQFDITLALLVDVGSDDMDAFERSFVEKTTSTYSELRGPITWRIAKELVLIAMRSQRVRERLFEPVQVAKKATPPKDMPAGSCPPPAVQKGRSRLFMLSGSGGFSGAVDEVMARGLGGRGLGVARDTHTGSTAGAPHRDDHADTDSVLCLGVPQRRSTANAKWRRGRAAPRPEHPTPQPDLASLVVGTDVLQAFDPTIDDFAVSDDASMAAQGSGSGTPEGARTTHCDTDAAAPPRAKYVLTPQDRRRHDELNRAVLAALDCEAANVSRLLHDVRRWKLGLLRDMKIFVHRSRARARRSERLHDAAVTPFSMQASLPRHRYLVHRMFAEKATLMAPRPVATPTSVLIECNTHGDVPRDVGVSAGDWRCKPPAPSLPYTASDLTQALVESDHAECGNPGRSPGSIGFSLEPTYVPPSQGLQQRRDMPVHLAEKTPSVLVPVQPADASTTALASRSFPYVGALVVLAPPEEIIASLREQWLYCSVPRQLLDEYYGDTRGAAGEVEGVVWRDQVAYVRFASDVAKWVPISALKPSRGVTDEEGQAGHIDDGWADHAVGEEPPPLLLTDRPAGDDAATPADPDLSSAVQPLFKDRAVRTKALRYDQGQTLAVGIRLGAPAPKRARRRPRRDTQPGLALSRELLPADDPALPAALPARRQKARPANSTRSPPRRGGNPLPYHVAGEPDIVGATLKDLCLDSAQGQAFMSDALNSGMLVKSHVRASRSEAAEKEPPPYMQPPLRGYRQCVTMCVISSPPPRTLNNVAMQSIRRAPSPPSTGRAPLAAIRRSIRRQGAGARRQAGQMMSVVL